MSVEKLSTMAAYRFCAICQKNWFTKKYMCPRCGAPIE